MLLSAQLKSDWVEVEGGERQRKKRDYIIADFLWIQARGPGGRNMEGEAHLSSQ